MLNTRPVSSKSAFGAEPKIRSSKMDEISAARLHDDTCNLRAANEAAGNEALAAIYTRTQVGERPVIYLRYVIDNLVNIGLCANGQCTRI